MGWNHKTESAGWVFLFLFPIIAGMMGVFVPFIHNDPVLFWILAVVLFIVGFIIVWKRAGRKSK